MDWLSVARLLAERCELPMVLLDRDGTIRLASASLERTLGLRPSDLEGRRWVEAFISPEGAVEAAAALEQGFAGATHSASCEALAKDGRKLRLSLDVFLAGRAPEQGLLVTVLSSAPVQGGWSRGQDLDYSVSFSATEFGVVKHAATPSGAELTEARGRRCYQFVAGLEKPCPDCPALRPALAGGQRLSVRGRTEPEGFQVISADATKPDQIALQIRSISSSTLAAIQDARIATLSLKAQLTERERDILALLLHGRSHDEIAQSLAVSPRTVKFHQGNILQKLGADSRADLLRLAGF